MRQVARFQGFWDLLALRSPEIFGSGMCDRIAGLYHVLSVFVVRCVVDTGTPSAAAIFLLPKPRVAMRSMAKRSSADRTTLL